MSLSKKNLGKLKNYIKENNLVNNNSVKNSQIFNSNSKVDDPSNIFYSIINNADNLNETLKENTFLKKSEDNFYNINSEKTNHSNNLSPEDELYDEFNYLLDE